MMPRPCIKPKKSPPSHHGHYRAMLLQRHNAPGASPTTAARAPTGDAALRSPVPGDGERVCKAGAPDGNTIAGAGTAGPDAGAGYPRLPPWRDIPVGGAADASGHPTHDRARGASADRIPIPPLDAGQGVAPL